MNIKKTILAAALTLGVGAQAYTPFLRYPERPLKYPKKAIGWEDGLVAHYEAWKARFLVNGLVKGTDPNLLPRYISEGQSYGMLLALWFNDQATFNTVWSATESNFWNTTSGWYGWLPPSDASYASSGGANFAGDADQDIAGALILASALVDSGYWTDNSVTVGGASYNYKAKAKVVVQSIWKNLVDTTGGYQIKSWPSANASIRNPSYHMPQWYPVFKEFGAANGLPAYNWDAVKTAAFALINAQPGAAKGMARNFSSSTGGTPGGGTSSPNNYDMGFDAIRVPYRMGMSAMWYKDAAAVSWCKSVWSSGFVLAAQPGMYTVAGPTLYGWGTAAANYADAKYEKPMSNAMWGTSAVAVYDSLAAAGTAFETIQSYIQNNAALNTLNYFSTYVVTDSSASKNPPNLNYYAQTVTLLGALAMAGKAWNPWDDLKHTWTVPDTSAKLSSFKTSKTTGVLGTDTATFTFALSKKALCTLAVVGNTTGAKYLKVVDSASGTVKWKFGAKSSVTGTSFSATGETLTATLRWAGMLSTTTGNTLSLTLNPSATIGIRGDAASASQLRRQADGSILVGQPWFADAAKVRVRVRNAAGAVLHSSEIEAEGGLVRVPAQRLAPGWYAVESEAEGRRSTQSFTLER